MVKADQVFVRTRTRVDHPARVDHPEHRSPRHHDSVNTLRFLRRVSAPTFHALPFPPLAARVRVLCRCCICCCPTVAAISMSRALLCPASAAIAAPLLSLRCRAHCCALSLPLLLSYVSPESLCSIPRTCCRCQCVLQLYCVDTAVLCRCLYLPKLSRACAQVCFGIHSTSLRHLQWRRCGECSTQRFDVSRSLLVLTLCIFVAGLFLSC